MWYAEVLHKVDGNGRRRSKEWWVAARAKRDSAEKNVMASARTQVAVADRRCLAHALKSAKSTRGGVEKRSL